MEGEAERKKLYMTSIILLIQKESEEEWGGGGGRKGKKVYMTPIVLLIQNSLHRTEFHVATCHKTNSGQTKRSAPF